MRMSEMERQGQRESEGIHGTEITKLRLSRADDGPTMRARACSCEFVWAET